MDQEPKTGWRGALEQARHVRWRVRYWIEVRLPAATQIRILQKRRREIVRDLDALGRMLGDEELARRQNMAWTATRDLNDRIAQLQTDALLTEAERLSLPLGDLSEDWEHTPISNRRVLSFEAQHRLRAAIRQEKKDRSELLRLWFAGVAPMVTALTGLAGTVIGLVALLTK